MEGKSVVTERLINTFRNKIYNYMTSVSVYIVYIVHIDKLADIVNEYNNKYNSIIKMKPDDVNSTTYIGFNVEKNDEDPKFEVVHHARISKYKNIFAKVYTPNWYEEVSVIKKIKSNRT